MTTKHSRPSDPPDTREASLENARPCAHEACGCHAGNGFADYCGAYCANVDTEASEHAACSCGHAECSDAQRVPRSEKDVVTSLGRGPGGK